jgi:hypothetical protein
MTAAPDRDDVRRSSIEKAPVVIPSDQRPHTSAVERLPDEIIEQ